jgi:hypothetical protein
VHNPQRRVVGENAAYRSGLVLGLTMAEVLLLLLFALLLIVGATWDHARRQIADLQPKADAYAAIVAADDRLAAVERLQRELASALADVEKLTPLLALQQVYEDIQREMRRLPPEDRAPRAVAERIQELVEIKAQVGPLQPSELVGAIQLSKEVREALPGVPLRDIVREMRAAQNLRRELAGQDLSQLVEVSAAVNALPLNPGEKPFEAITRIGREIANIRGQNIELSRRIQAERRGNQFPSCWATPEGREEAIFDITYNEAGIEVFERSLPHRDADRRLLPLQSTRYERIMSPAEFRAELMPLYRWSVSNNCRFHVVLFARGKIDRMHQNAVNAFFYPASSIQAR